MTPMQKARIDAMEVFGCTEKEYEEHKKEIEGSYYFRRRVARYSIIELGLACKEKLPLFRRNFRRKRQED